MQPSIKAIQIAASNINPHKRHRARPSLSSRPKSAMCWKDDQRPLAKPLFLPTTYASVLCVMVEFASQSIYLAEMNTSSPGRLKRLYAGAGSLLF